MPSELGIQHCGECGVGHRCGSDPVLLWHRLAAATLIQPPAWKLTYAKGVALKSKKKKKKKIKIIKKKKQLYKIKKSKTKNIKKKKG